MIRAADYAHEEGPHGIVIFDLIVHLPLHAYKLALDSLLRQALDRIADENRGRLLVRHRNNSIIEILDIFFRSTILPLFCSFLVPHNMKFQVACHFDGYLCSNYPAN